MFPYYLRAKIIQQPILGLNPMWYKTNNFVLFSKYSSDFIEMYFLGFRVMSNTAYTYFLWKKEWITHKTINCAARGRIGTNLNTELLVPSFHVSPGQHQPWCWLCMAPMSSIKKGFRFIYTYIHTHCCKCTTVDIHHCLSWLVTQSN